MEDSELVIRHLVGRQESSAKNAKTQSIKTLATFVALREILIHRAILPCRDQIIVHILALLRDYIYQ